MAAKSPSHSLPKVLTLKPPTIFPFFESQFSLHFHFLKAYESSLPLPAFLAHATSAGVEAMLLGGGTPITGLDVLDHLPTLKCIVTTTAGLDSIDLHECRRRGVAVAYAGEVYSDDCADHAVGIMIDVMRMVSAGDRYVRSGSWSLGTEFSVGCRLGSKRIGIVGLGSIGSRVAKRLDAFGCSILYNSRQKNSFVPYPYYSDIHELAAASDALVICCALTNEARHMINKQVLSALGKEGIIVNIARGPIIDERQLVKSLQEGEIAGAGLDVFEKEPGVPEELFALENVVLSPHVAYNTRESFRDMFELVKENLQAFFSNKPLLTPVAD